MRLNEHMEQPDGLAGFEHACRMGLEGIVSKRLGSRHRSGQSAASRTWSAGEECRRNLDPESAFAFQVCY